MFSTCKCVRLFFLLLLLCMISLAVEGPREEVMLGSEEILLLHSGLTGVLCLLLLIVGDGEKGSD